MRTKIRCLKAFSLVELSISLVIIGLLIAGVTGGQNLIKQAELKATVQEFNNFKTDYMSFIAAFNAPPGDFASASVLWGTNCHATADNCNGDGNGLIDVKDIPPVGAGTGSEAMRAYKHLSLAGISAYSFPLLTNTGQYLGATDGFGVDPPVIPKKFTNACYYYATSNRADNAVGGGPIDGFVGYKIFAAGKYGSPWFPDVVPAVYLGGIWGNVGGYDQVCSKPVLNPVDMFNIDVKIDDGAYSSTNATGANSGNFRTVIDGASTTCANGTNYTLTGVATCLVGYRIQ